MGLLIEAGELWEIGVCRLGTTLNTGRWVGGTYLLFLFLLFFFLFCCILFAQIFVNNDISVCTHDRIGICVWNRLFHHVLIW